MSIELILGDCLEVMRTMPDKSVDAVITDPPYDINPNLNEMQRIATGNIVMFCAPENPYFNPDELAYWIKTPSTKNYSKHLGRFVEWILIKRNNDVFNTDLHWSNYTGVYEDKLLYKPIHPFEKPLSLMMRLISIYTKPGDTVLDCFAGSGTTGVACVQTGRNFIGIEIDPTYYAIAEKRIKDAQQQMRLPLEAA